MYGVGRLIEYLELNNGAVVRASTFDDGCVGLMPVYATREQALKAYPFAQVFEVMKEEE